LTITVNVGENNFYGSGCRSNIKLPLRRTLVLHQRLQQLNFKISQF